MIFNLLHITDCHFSRFSDYENTVQTAFETRHPLDILKAFFIVKDALSLGASGFSHPTSYDSAVANQMFRYLKKIISVDPNDPTDLLIFTGDIANTGDEQDLDAAADFLMGRRFGQFPNMEDTSIEKIRVPFMLMPGNHDRFDGLLNKPGSTNFEDKFGSRWDFRTNASHFSKRPGAAIVGDMVRAISIHKNNDVRLVVICADFSLRYSSEAHFPEFMGQGEINKIRLDALIDATKLTRNKDEDAVIVWGIHFPPMFKNVPPSLRLIDEDRLVEAAIENDIGLILSGHTHEKDGYWIDVNEQVKVICGGSASSYGSEHGNHINEISFFAENAKIDQDTIQCRVHSYDDEFCRWEFSGDM